MKNAILLLVLSLMITLQGCVSTGVNGEKVIGRPGSLFWFDSADRATITAHYKENCTSYGYKDKTPEMTQCLQTEIREGKRDAHVQFDQGMKGFSQATQPRETYRTNCTTWGSNTSCTTR